jgi:two-component system, LytTR family, sensor kinase
MRHYSRRLVDDTWTLILQPVVENAIQHAIAPRAARGHINIEAKRLNSLLRVTISDNGPGISSNANSLGKKCVGLSNVRSRLQQFYGPDFRFELMNAGDGGLTVVIEIPFQREGIMELSNNPHEESTD